MDQQNISLLYPNLSERQGQLIQKAYENNTILEFHGVVQQIKTKFPIPNHIDPVEFPTQENAIQFFENYKPIILEINGLGESKIKLYKNAAYFGALQDGLREGNGVLIKQTLQLYEGGFIKDKKEGIGFEILKGGQYYYGHYVNGLPQGEGVFWSNNLKYIGQWHQGKKHGIGWYSGQHSDYYLGQWENGKCFGFCLHIMIDLYVGQVVNDLKHGFGIEYFENGDMFEGEYRNGKPNGQGEYKWNNGNNYKGEFQNGLRNGQGIWINHTQEGINCYKGQYANDKKCGAGKFQYANGTIYDGYFIEDKRCGYGEMVWSDGAQYKGYWNSGLMDGEGIYTFQQLILKGNWCDNQLNDSEKVRVALKQFPQKQQIKEINDSDQQSNLEDEPDQDEIGEQFDKGNLAQVIKEKTQSHNTTQTQFQNRLPLLQKQFDLLSLLDQSLSIDEHRCSHVAIQTDSKKQFLPKLALSKRTPTQFSSTVEQKNIKKKCDSFSTSPKTRETNSTHKTTKTHRVQMNKPNKSLQCRPRRNKEILLNKKEQNIWAIKMTKLKLSPTRYTRLWNHEVVSEIKQFLYPPVWKPPSHLN